MLVTIAHGADGHGVSDVGAEHTIGTVKAKLEDRCAASLLSQFGANAGLESGVKVETQLQVTVTNRAEVDALGARPDRILGKIWAQAMAAIGSARFAWQPPNM